jgi:prolyl oligopeptidase
MKLASSVRLVIAVCLLALVVLAQGPSIPQPPATPKRPVTEEYQGVKVTDDYRWLENWDDPEVKQWSAAQNARSREYLDHLPARPAIQQMLKQALSASSAAYYDLQFRGGTLFAMKYQPPQQQPMLVALPSADDPAGAKIVFNPNASSAKGSTAVDFYVPSLDGKFVAAALSENGSEDSSAHVFEVATGKELSDVVPRVNFATAGGSLEWKADSSGFYYTRFPQGTERPPEDVNFYQQVYFHRLGADPRQDTYVIGKDFPRIAEIQLHASDDGQWLIAAVANGDGGEFAHYVMDAAGHWTQVTHFVDRIVAVKPGPDAALYLLSRKGAPRGQVLRLPLAHLDLAEAKVIVPQSSGTAADESARASIEDFTPTRGHLYVADVVGGPSRIRVFDLQGHPLPGPPLPPVSAVRQLVPTHGGDVLFNVATYLEPSAWYRFDAATGKSIRTALFRTSPLHFDDTEVVREFATSKDGTRVPVNIIRRRGTRLDGSNPTLLEAYGGYGVNLKPYANVRGGGEYGEEWHQAGRLTRKQDVFDDFIACAQHLIERKYSAPAHLAAIGGSNGGLLMGAAFTQRPDLFRAVVSYVGIYDMLRVELDPNGAFNVTEFGTVKDPDQFKALYAYSPYHHVKDGTSYPAILFPTGENDHRVNPMQSRKMTARLQAATSSGYPILLRTSSNAGHGIGTAVDEQIEEDADVLSFLFDQLGIKYATPSKLGSPDPPVASAVQVFAQFRLTQ